MSIEMHGKAHNTLAAFAEQHGLTMEIHERTPGNMGAIWTKNNRYYAYFKKCETKEGSILRGTSGNGETPDAAMAEYAEKISEKKLVFNAYGKDRREIDVPMLTHNAG